MSDKHHDVTDAELAVLESLWTRTASTIRELTDELYPDGGTAHYATVQKLLERLEAKGCVERERERVPHVYRATIARDDLIVGRLRDLADRLCGGSIAPLLSNLVRGRALTARERSTLRELVEDLDGRRRARR